MLIFKHSKLLMRISFLFVLSSISISPLAEDKLLIQGPVYIDHSTDPAVVIIDYQRNHPMLADKKGAGSIKVYGDGRAVIYFPEYMKKSGTYELFLSEVEIQALLQRLTNPGQTATPERATQGNAKVVTQMSSDHSSSKLNLHLSTTITQFSNEVTANSLNKSPSLSVPSLDPEIEKPLLEILERNDMIPLYEK